MAKTKRPYKIYFPIKESWENVQRRNVKYDTAYLEPNISKQTPTSVPLIYLNFKLIWNVLSDYDMIIGHEV